MYTTLSLGEGLLVLIYWSIITKPLRQFTGFSTLYQWTWAGMHLWVWLSSWETPFCNENSQAHSKTTIYL